jgi:hypothetical protein
MTVSYGPRWVDGTAEVPLRAVVGGWVDGLGPGGGDGLEVGGAVEAGAVGDGEVPGVAVVVLRGAGGEGLADRVWEGVGLWLVWAGEAEPPGPGAGGTRR